MTADVCEKMSRKLVDCSDGELPPDESQAVMDHVATCPDCAKLLKALDVSLTLTTSLWEHVLAAKTVDRKSRDVITTTSRRWHCKTVAFVAACVALVLSVALIWKSVSPPSSRLHTLSEIEQNVQESGRAARQLMVAEILASCDDTEEMLERHHRYIAETFSDVTFGSMVR